ncbi:MAG: alpha/beta-hydrolase family protein [Thermoleophilia bacterium]|nr:alpha/beta-hydrolase family protein [Thermoleophilia bacterium]
MAPKPAPVRGVAGVLPHVARVVPQDPATASPVVGMGEAGARFVGAVPLDLPKRPIRAYAALASAPTVEGRVELVMRELERTGAFDRRFLVIGAPTGGGHVNPVALELIERMAGGDVASVAIQFGTLPSVLSFGKVDDERGMLELLMRRIRDRIRSQHPHGGGPKVVLYGESLGGWASQGALEEAAAKAQRQSGRPVDPLRNLGVDTAVWIGIPGFSRFQRDQLGNGGMQVLHGIDALTKLDPAQRSTARAWELSHYDDPVHRADLATIWRRPDWLPADGNNPHGVDPSQRWKPLLTFFDTMKMVFTTANKERAGVFTDHGHDYRKELPQLLRTALGFDGTVSDAQLARITEQVRQSEVWIMQQKWQ